MFKIEISENGTVTGYLSTEQFRQAVGAPITAFLPEVVEKFNEWKASKNEAARARIA